MSVGARRINKIEYEQGETFNLWQDKKVTIWLQNNTEFYDVLNSDLCGVAELPVETVEELINFLLHDNDPEYKDTIEWLERDVKWAKDNKKDFLMYYCF
jgi:hypothetical protein